MTSINDALIDEYIDELTELLPLAKRAYGAKDQDTPNHEASRRYTQVLCEYHERGGSLIAIAQRLGVAYSGIRRRIYTADVPSVKRTRLPGGKVDAATVAEAAQRVKVAKDISPSEYHKQLHAEFAAGIPMNMLARQLGISNAAPLYYGVQSYERRMAKAGEVL